MTLNLSKQDRIYKKLFSLPLPQRDGLILKVHHTTNSLKIRFQNACFNKTGNLLALADNEANIFVLDFNTQKFWNIPKTLNSCIKLKFSHFKEKDILAGAHNGTISVIDTETGYVIGELIGHQCPVLQMSFSSDFLLLSASVCEAILWDLRTNSKLQILNLEHSCTIKYASFIPVTNDVLTCFNDDFIQIWQFGTFQMKNQIPPLVWYGHEVKNVTFTLDGKIMAIGCRSPHLAVFLLSNYKLLKFIKLPEYIQTLRHVEFVPLLHDGGSNKIIAILSGRGSIYFYNIDKNIIMSELVACCEISKWDFSNKGNFFTCVLCSGDVNIYDVIKFTVIPIQLTIVRAPTPNRKLKLKKCLEKMGIVKMKIREILQIEKLRMILKECGEYPDRYRMTIWEHLLELPNNQDRYNAVINSKTIICFENLAQSYPLTDKRCLNNLKQVLENLVVWCPFFLHVDFLPSLVFPFVKVFRNKPLTCFEAACTIIINWCQFWFEYFPLPPINILAIIENMLMEHDPELLQHFMVKKVATEVYAWRILINAFSETLTAASWKCYWDHVLTNEPSFLLCGVVAYNILHRRTLLTLKDQKQLICFYNTHHPVDVKKLLARTYRILGKTSASVHPRQYLNMFRKIKLGEYPNFCDYPKTAIEYKDEKSAGLKKDIQGLKTDEVDVFKKRLISLEKLQDLDMQQIEADRILEMENAIREQVREEQSRVGNYYERLAKLRQLFGEEDKVLSSLKGKIAREYQRTSRQKYLSALLQDIQLQKSGQDFKLSKNEDELLYHYSELVKNKNKVQELLATGTTSAGTKISEKSTSLKTRQEELGEDYSVNVSKNSRQYLQQLNLETGLNAIDCLIGKIKEELKREKAGVVDEKAANERMVTLKKETHELESEVDGLLQLISDLRNAEFGG